MVADAHQALSVRSHIPDDLPPVEAPAALLEAVLETLVENSRQAGARTVEIAARQADSQVIVSVSDDGRGIAGTDHERIFEPFHTGRRAEGGSGLGLPIARSLLASCGGSIASRETAGGARFEISLPVASG